MGVNMDAMRKDKEKRKRESSFGADSFSPKDTGQYLLYVAPPCRDDDLPYVQCNVHYGVGEKNRMLASLDFATNKIMADARVQEFLDKRQEDDDSFTPPDGSEPCPLDLETQRRKKAGDKRGFDDIKVNKRFIWNVVPMGYRKRNTDDWEEPDELKLCTFWSGTMAWNAIMDVFLEEGDISDPTKAVLVKFTREGKGMKTEYKATADSDTIREPMSLPKALRKLIAEELKAGGRNDLYKVAADAVEDYDTIKKMLTGVSEEEDEEWDEWDEDEEEEKPAPKKRQAKKPARKRRPAPKDEDDDDEEEEKPKPKRKRRPAPPPEDDEEDDSDGDDDDDEDLDDLERRLQEELS